MNSEIVLEMINNGEIEGLKSLLRDEIYRDSLRGNGNAKSRYMAMKRYFKFARKDDREVCKLPCKNIMANGREYNSFFDGYSFAFTTESIGEINSYDNSKADYLNVEGLISSYIFAPSRDKERIDFNKIIADAKSKGYKYKKDEVARTEGKGFIFNYALKYKDAYFKLGQIDQAYSIVNDGEPSTVYCQDEKSILYIETSLGIAGILPVSPKGFKECCTQKEFIIINAEDFAVKSKY